MRNLFLALLCSIFLVACGSTVPLDQVPVADASISNIQPGSVTATSSVAGVQSETTNADQLGPDGLPLSLTTDKKIVYFDYDSFVVKPEFEALIAENAKVMLNQPNRQVAIEGHTDERGGREYNLALGQKRADAVVAALKVLGVSGEQLEAVSFGKEKPAVPGNDEAAYARNRRVEIRYR